MTRFSWIVDRGSRLGVRAAGHGSRFFFTACLLLLLTGCASTPSVSPPPPLHDRSADTDYILDSVAERIREADRAADDGLRLISAAIYEAALEVLPTDAARERDYVRLLMAAMWGRAGEGRDGKAAYEILDGVSPRDDRLAADWRQARAVILLGEDDLNAAILDQTVALALLEEIEAHARWAEAALGFAHELKTAGRTNEVETWARRGLSRSRRLGNDLYHLQSCLEAAPVIASEAADLFQEAYGAAYAINDLGWRNVVIASAVAYYHARDDMAACVYWGNRIRDRELGELPGTDETALFPTDALPFFARYALALDATNRGDLRAGKALRHALQELERHPRVEIPQRREWRQKLAAALLHYPEDS